MASHTTSAETHTLDGWPILVKQKLTEKRKARKRWQITRAPQDKHKYNKLGKELKHLLLTLKNGGVQQYLTSLMPTIATNYSFWKATCKMKHSQQHIPPLQLHNDTWARADKQKATALTEHLATVFRLFPPQSTALEKENLLHELNVPHQMALPLKKIQIHRVIQVIQYKIHPTKAPGYNLITGKILKELSQKGFRAVMQIYNAILRLKYFTCHWKVRQIIMIAKPGKNPADVMSHRPISLLPLLSKTL